MGYFKHSFIFFIAVCFQSELYSHRQEVIS